MVKIEIVGGFCDGCGENRRLARVERDYGGSAPRFTALCWGCLKHMAAALEQNFREGTYQYLSDIP